MATARPCVILWGFPCGTTLYSSHSHLLGCLFSRAVELSTASREGFGEAFPPLCPGCSSLSRPVRAVRRQPSSRVCSLRWSVRRVPGERGALLQTSSLSLQGTRITRSAGQCDCRYIAPLRLPTSRPSRVFPESSASVAAPSRASSFFGFHLAFFSSSSRFRRPSPLSPRPSSPSQSTHPVPQPEHSSFGPGSHRTTIPTGQQQRMDPNSAHWSSSAPAAHRALGSAPTWETSTQEKSGTGEYLPTFAQQFLNDRLLSQDKVQFTKVSEKGTPDALFAECLDSIRRRRYELDPDVDNRPSAAIEKLTQEERAIATNIFQRVDPERKVAPRLEFRGHYIDPLWDPFKRVEELQQQVAQDLTEFSKLVGAAEARRQRLLLRASLRRQYRMHDPLNEGHRRFFGSPPASPFPVPHRVHERFWDPSADVRVALKNRNIPISWRDLHILHHFIGDNGLVLPRRTTHASRYQQRCIFKAISTARRMALFPYDWKPTPGELMPVMDPLQYLVDELTSRYKATGDLRADAMLRVMVCKYPRLNYFRYTQSKAEGKQRKRQALQQQEEEDQGDFTRLLQKYKRASRDNQDGYRPTAEP